MLKRQFLSTSLCFLYLPLTAPPGDPVLGQPQGPLSLLLPSVGYPLQLFIFILPFPAVYNCVLGSCCCCGLKTTGIYSLTVLEVRSSKWVLRD